MSDNTQPAYQVLARKYRPETFADLIGQDAMVRTLKNAFATGRIAQAFMMTGIRGTGKTTTARIIAKGMNCIGPDGQSAPSTEPCGGCAHCQAISEGRHVDVLEMDAASNTGVDDIRSTILDSVAYAPSSARFKVYIIDEVHMLSKSAFNALLKTLEEPPAHVKFIFATTEIRKVPVTVLSRCQRFDLRRIEPEDMIGLLRRIADCENAKIETEALALITRAAEGSARDATSLLDQAISHGAGETTADQVRAMMGLADRGRVMDLFDLVMRGDAAGALAEISSQYADGADPMAVIRDLAEITHWISVVKITPDAAEDPTVGPDERLRGLHMAGELPMRALSRMWQMLLKAIDEVALAPNAMMAAEMALIRLTHVAELPSPEDLIRKLGDAPVPAPPGPVAAPIHRAGSSGQTGQPGQAVASPAPLTPGTSGTPGPVAALRTEQALARFPTFEHVIELIRHNRDVKLLVDVEAGVRLAAYQPGRIEFTLAEAARSDLPQKLGSALQRWTGNRWAVSLVNNCDALTIAEKRDAHQRALVAKAQAHPLVQIAFAAFPKAKITAIHTAEAAAAEAEAAALAVVEDEWDPFEET